MYQFKNLLPIYFIFLQQKLILPSFIFPPNDKVEQSRIQQKQWQHDEVCFRNKSDWLLIFQKPKLRSKLKIFKAPLLILILNTYNFDIIFSVLLNFYYFKNVITFFSPTERRRRRNGETEFHSNNSKLCSPKLTDSTNAQKETSVTEVIFGRLELLGPFIVGQFLAHWTSIRECISWQVLKKVGTQGYIIFKKF